MDPKKNHLFSTDRPIEQIPQDRLGRSFFASRLADAVSNWNQNDSLVLAICGQWGAGKTSLKNLFKCHCKDKGDPYIAEFNPWQWSAQDKIFPAFFKVVEERLRKPDMAKQSKELARKWKYFAAYWAIGKEAGKHIAESAGTILLFTGGLSGLAAWAPNAITRPILGAASFVTLLAGALAKLVPALAEKTAAYFEAKAACHEKDLEDRRRELAAELRRLDKPLIVIVDDFDRLNKDEIKLVIQLIKANSDLPNVVFMLLFNQEVVAAALTDSWQSGRDYLEKIIQVGFDIPEAPPSKLRATLLEELDAIFAGIDMGPRWDKARWDYVLKDLLKDYFLTLRDVYRFTSMLKFHVNLHRNADVLEVNPIDLIILHTLRVFEHPVFERIKNSAVSDASRWMTLFFLEDVGDVKNEPRTILLDEIVSGVEEHKRHRIAQLITELFPQVGPHFRGDDASWERDLRICHQDHFPKYFEFSLREGTISILELSTLLRSAHDPTATATTLRRHIALGSIADLLTRMQFHLDTIPDESISPFLQAFLQVSEHIPKGEDKLMTPSPTLLAVTILKALLRRLPEEKRAQIMSIALQASDAFVLPAHLVDLSVGRPNQPTPVTPLLNETNSKRLKAIAVEKIQTAADDGRARASAHFLWLLDRWRTWAGDDKASNWVNSFITDGPTALEITMAAVSVCSVASNGQTRTYDSLCLGFLEQLADLEALWGHLRKLDRANLTDRETHVLSLFERGLRNKGNGEPYNTLSDATW